MRYRYPRATIVPVILDKFGNLANNPQGHGGPRLQRSMFNDDAHFMAAKRERDKLWAQDVRNGYVPPGRSGTTSTGVPRTPRTPKVKMHGGPAFTTALPTAAELQVQALAKLEDALVMTAQEKGITAATEAAFTKYQKLKTMALAQSPTSNLALRNEANVAMRMALIEIIKIAF